MVRAFLLVAVVAILAAAPASAQVSFNVTSSAQTVRTEGQTETAGSVNMNWASGSQISPGSSITLTYATATVVPSSPYVSAKVNGTACTPLQNTVAATGTCTGMSVTTSGASVVISFIGTTTPPGAGVFFTTGDYIQVAQTRLNVAAVTGAQPISGTTSLFATISGNSPSANTVTFNQNQVQVASISSSLNVKLSGAVATQSTCAVVGNTFTVTAAEVFPAALTTFSDESNFTPNFGTPTGTIVNVVLSNVPNGFVITPLAVTDNATSLPGTGAITNTPVAQTSTGAGTPLTFAYTMALDNTSIVETLTFGFGLAAGGASIAPSLNSQTLASPQSITAQIYLGPLTSTPVVRFTQLNYPSTPITVATISDCTSILLFPYVTNEASFDTNITIANTGLDAAALGVQTAAKANGTCKFILYPTASATGAVGTTQNSFVTPTIQAGGSYQVLLSKAYPKLSGYMFAVCNFLTAHGFGYFVGPSSNGGVLTQGELALVVPSSRSAGGSEGLLQ